MRMDCNETYGCGVVVDRRACTQPTPHTHLCVRQVAASLYGKEGGWPVQHRRWLATARDWCSTRYVQCTADGGRAGASDADEQPGRR
jgi:hypothetical protein